MTLKIAGRRLTSTLAIAAAGLIGICATAQAAQSVTGNWLTIDGKAIVQIGFCGKALCGKVVKVLKPMPGRPTTDIANPDPKLRNRPIEGISILTGFSDAGSLWKGNIYDPESGKTYNSKLIRNPDGTLKVQGCIAFFCQTQIWTPAR